MLLGMATRKTPRRPDAVPIMFRNRKILFRGKIAFSKDCCCGCCSRKPASLFINLDSIVAQAPAECNGGTADVGLNWELSYDAANDWWYGTESSTGFGYKVWCDVSDPGNCRWFGQPYCNNEVANAELELTVHSENPIDLEAFGVTWGNPGYCNCFQGETQVHPIFNASITE